MVQKKDESIETIRGIAIILMVAAHTLGQSSDEGMRLTDDSFGRFMYYLLIHIRMPLFTVISGYVYAHKPIKKEYGILNFLKGKGRRLLLPLISVGSIQYLFQCYIPGVNNQVQILDIWKIYIFSYSHFWFIQAIFTVFIFVSIIEYYNLMTSIKKWLVVLVFSCLTFFLLKNIGDFFSITTVFYLFPFFILGCGLNRFGNIIFMNNKIMAFLFIIALAGLTIQQLEYLDIINIKINRRSLISLLIGISATSLLIKYKFTNKLLVKIGYYSYGIFLLHLFGSASTRILLEIIDENINDVIIFAISLCMGIVVPIIIEIVIMRFKKLKLIMLGLKN